MYNWRTFLWFSYYSLYSICVTVVDCSLMGKKIKLASRPDCFLSVLSEAGIQSPRRFKLLESPLGHNSWDFPQRKTYLWMHGPIYRNFETTVSPNLDRVFFFSFTYPTDHNTTTILLPPLSSQHKRPSLLYDLLHRFFPITTIKGWAFWRLVLMFSMGWNTCGHRTDKKFQHIQREKRYTYCRKN